MISMKKALFLPAAMLFAAIAVIGYTNVGRPELTTAISTAQKPAKTMRAFRSEQELKDFFKALAERQQKSRAKRESGLSGVQSTVTVTADAAAAAPSPGAKAGKDDESITNTQHAGVDEGGIVKLHGEHLVILRRGRLFTVKIGDNALRPVDAVDAYAAGSRSKQRLV